MKILLVEDDETLAAALTRSLTAQNFVVDAVPDGEMGWSYGSTFDYDLILLDVMLPKLDGISLCKKFRAEDYTTPILLLTSEDTSTAKVQGLDAGADDYVVKPFDRAELIARIRALLRRSSTNPLPLLIWRDLMLNPGTCDVSYDGQPLTLTRKEYELLELFLRDSQHVFSTEEILDRLWSSEEFPSEATVRSHIRRVRNKLTAAGAPPDFVATLHGRGYYLKPAETVEELVCLLPDPGPSSLAPATAALAPITPEAQEQYVAFLNQNWVQITQPKTLEQVGQLEQAVEALQSDRLTPPLQTQAKQIAHKLAGTLGLFGFHKAVHLTRQLENWMGSQESLLPRQASLMFPLVTALRQEIQNSTVVHSSQVPSNQGPLLLLVGLGSSQAQAIAASAEARQLRTVTLPTATSAASWLTPEAIASLPIKPPDALLVQLPSESRPELAENRNAVLTMVQSFAQRFPNLPILVMGDRDTLSDRLDALRHGSHLFLPAVTPPEQTISAITHRLNVPDSPAKVMIVDNDVDWLRALPTLLKPWGFKVTTLDDPQQFWIVLQAVNPDVLVLNAHMSQITGYELCQILRCDPYWQRLPVVFLSDFTDLKSQNQAFAAGADDYLYKPIIGADLAARIVSRLHRLRAYIG
ncbi:MULTISPECIES: response regulator [unclassified Leptolyngbya]|uniref:response regulator n=1 Tax=unclassified Leptolyngbya TaxID=2650499 RepID=UPI00168714F6|nr:MULTISPECIES: response regulator [unclassified Leptolyngbya]MBD1910405.1 response regulator [Leptolyngbya sp. FACHB-8]MBD2157801.1 response regulator [Leptolyngbya sp. FACHB-16]